MRPSRIAHGFVGLFGAWLLWTGVASVGAADEKAATTLLAEARKAQEGRNYPAAIQHYRNLLARHADSKDAPAARFGLGVCLIEGQPRDDAAAAQQLRMLADNKEAGHYPSALLYFGLAERGLGFKELARPAGNAKEIDERRGDARKHFEEAAKQFASSADAFTARAKKAEGAALSPDGEGAVKARCNQAEMLLHLDKAKEARDLTAPLLKEAALEKTRYRGLARYYHGWANFDLKDYQAAGRSLSALAPFGDSSYGTHARYLLGRVHHLSDERAEAAAAYEGVLADYEKQAGVRDGLRKRAAEPRPMLEYVGRSIYYLGLLAYEAGRFADAQARFAVYLQQFPKSPLAASAQLRFAACLVEGKQYPEALRVLQGLAEREPALADQTLYWTGRAWAGIADPKNPQTNPQAWKNARDAFASAAEKARELAKDDADAPARRGKILFEWAELLLMTRQFKEAAVAYRHLVNDKAVPGREAELLQRLAAALHLAGDYADSEKACERFVQEHPRSPLLPAVVFRQAENNLLRAFAAEKEGKDAAEVKKLVAEAEKQYGVLVERYPEFEYTGRVRYGLALCLYRKGDVDKARELLETVPTADHVDDLANVPYLLTDWLIRATPTRADDALQAAKMQENLTSAITLLEAYIVANLNGPQMADALLKLGLCKQRLAQIQAEPKDKIAILGSAGRRFDRLLTTFPQHPLAPQATLEKARCLALAGNAPAAIAALQPFLNEPGSKTAAAPLAILELATLLRAQNKPAEAAVALANCRKVNDAALLKDPARASWAAALQLQQGLSLREAGKLPEARAVFDGLAKQFADRPEAWESALRIGQILRDEAMQKADKSRQAFAGLAKLDDLAAALKAWDGDSQGVRDAVLAWETAATKLKDKPAALETRARMLYDAAWGSRGLADVKIAAARLKLLQERLPHKEGQAAAVVTLAEVPLSLVPVQPEEKAARGFYEALIAAAPDLPLAIEARVELAELLVERNEVDPAIKLLGEALDKEPSPEVTDKIRLLLGACRAAKSDLKGAMEQFEAVTKNPKSPLIGIAPLLAGEALLRAGDFSGAAKQLAVYRDQPGFRLIPNVTDLALLRLGQALAEQKQEDASRQAYEKLLAEFAGSPWVTEARFGIGMAYQNAKDYDNAVNAYAKAAESPTLAGGRAQLQIAACRMEQKKPAEALAALQALPAKFPFPELLAAALLETGRVHAELKQKPEAEKAFQQAARDYPKSKWSAAAEKQLKGLADGAALARLEVVAELVANDAKKPASLPTVARAASDKASFDDPSADLSLAFALSRSVVTQKAPVAYLRMALPDPFEFHSSNRLEAAVSRDSVAPLPPWPAGNP